jgi:hypothetical protein
MRLGFDLDGTLADMQHALAREAYALYPSLDPDALPRSVSDSEPQDESGAPGKARSLASTNGLSPRQLREVWQAACARVNFWETLAEIEPGALARLYALAQERRWELIFLTSRPESAGDTAQAQSYRWLKAHGYATPSVFVVHGSRGKIAAALALDVLVDDRPENCLDVAIDSTARPILVWRGDEDKVPASARQLGIGAVSSIAEVLDILSSLDRTTDDATVVDRLKRLLGLRPRAARSHDHSHRPVATARA